MAVSRRSHPSKTPSHLSKTVVSRRRFLHTVGSTALWGMAQGSTVHATQAAQVGLSDAAIGYAQKLRPQFHFTALAGWINDPNGLVYVDGVYHLYFQFLPHTLQGSSGNKFWGHAISRDLVRWQQLPVAISPDKYGGIWSGSAAVDSLNTAGFQKGNKPAVVAMYTAAGGSSKISQGEPFTQCLAYSNDGGLTFTKYAHNPVLKQIVPGNRDPKIIWHGPSHRWIMPLFLNGSRGFALFNSPDLKHWIKLQELHFPQSQECPNFFPLPLQGRPGEVRWIFTGADSQYLIGQFDGRRFTAQSGPFAMDTGNSFYAAQVYNNIPARQNRTIQIGWMRGGSYPGMPFNQQLSFPCTLTLRNTPDGLRVCREPVPEIEHLWRHAHHFGPFTLDNRRRNFHEVAGNQLDIEAQIHAGTAKVLALEVAGQTIEVNFATRQISALGAKGSIIGSTPTSPLRLRILVDRTSIEVFAPDHAVSMSSCYLPPAGKSSMACYCQGGKATVGSLAVREVASAWKGA